MSYEVSNVNTISQDDYVCSNNEVESNFFIFEIKISTFDDTEYIYRKISYKNKGILLEVENNIKKIKISMCRINSIDNLIIIRKHFNNIITQPTILCKDDLIITLENDDSIIIKYNI